jgi:hypothetical protein
MAFSEIYDITFPPDTQAISQGALDIRNFKQDIAQRIANLSGITVAAAEALGYETNFYGAPFIDSTTGKIYNIGGTFSEITPLILANISESNTTLQAAIVAALAAIPPTSPGPLVLPALVGLQSPQITSGPGADLPTTPTVTQAIGILTPTVIASTGYVQAAQANVAPQSVTYGANTLVVKIPNTFNSAGAPLTFLTIQGGLSGSGGSPAITFTVPYLATPVITAVGLNGSCNISSTTPPSTSGITFNSTAVAVYWIAVGISS